MSIIANALQKQNQQQSEISSEGSNNTIWKALLLSALMVIILLSCVLIWVLNRPAIMVAPVMAPVQEKVVVTPLKNTQPQREATLSVPEIVEPKIVNTPNKPKGKIIETVSFETKPLPLINLNEMNVALKVEQKEVASEQILEQKKTNESIEVVDTSTESITDNIPEELAYNDVSDNLKEHFQEALTNSQDDRNDESESSALNIYKMESRFQQQVPTIRYDFHVYSSNQSDRWIRINGEDLKEGDVDSSGKIQVVTILPNQTDFRVDGQVFYLKSLTDWLSL